MKIKVTRRDIERARKLVKKVGCLRTRLCPIALAAKRKTHKKVSVGATDIVVYRGERYTMYTMPMSARHFVLRFDHNLKVKPFAFEVTRLRPKLS